MCLYVCVVLCSVCVYTCMCVRMRKCVCVCVCARACVRVCITISRVNDGYPVCQSHACRIMSVCCLLLCSYIAMYNYLVTGKNSYAGIDKSKSNQERLELYKLMTKVVATLKSQKATYRYIYIYGIAHSRLSIIILLVV